MRHDFPGNARELENIIEYGFVLCHDRLIEVRHLPQHLQPCDASESGELEGAPLSALQRGEAETIRIALSQNQGRRGLAARELGISRTTLWRKMKKYGIDTEDIEPTD